MTTRKILYYMVEKSTSETQPLSFYKTSIDVPNEYARSDYLVKKDATGLELSTNAKINSVAHLVFYIWPLLEENTTNAILMKTSDDSFSITASNTGLTITVLQQTIFVSLDMSTYHLVDVSSGGIVIDGVTKGEISFTNLNSYLVIFDNNSDFVGNIYNVYILDDLNDELTTLLVPSIRQSDSVCGYYDIVSDTFYYDPALDHGPMYGE